MPAKYDLSFLDRAVLEAQRAHEEVFEGLSRGEQPGYVPAYCSEVFCLPLTGPYDAEAWLAEQLKHLRCHAARYQDRVTWRPFGLSLARFDLHFPSAVLGCPVFRRTEGPVWWTSLSQQGVALSDFRPRDPLESPLVQEMVELLTFTAEATEGRVPIEIPYVAEPLVLAVDLFGEEFLAALVRDPALADRVLEELTEAMLRMRQRFLEAAPGAPLRAHGSIARAAVPGGTQLYGCTTQLVSAETYCQHVLERDRRLLRCRAAGGCIHLCGRHLQHRAAWRELPEVHSLQLNDAACDDLAAYWRALRPDQFLVVVPSARVRVEEAVAITRGRQLVVNADVQERIRWK